MADFRSARDVVVAVVRAGLATVPFDAPDTAKPSPAAARITKRANGLIGQLLGPMDLPLDERGGKKVPGLACGAIERAPERAPGPFSSILGAHWGNRSGRLVAGFPE